MVFADLRCTLNDVIADTVQLITVDSPNVHVYRSEGNTDEQAEVLKEIFMDEAWVKEHNICSINSINWGRITAQSSYYIWSYLQMRPAVDGPVNFIIPTGALGNALGKQTHVNSRVNQSRLKGLPF